jgi:hypothetical protein
VVACFVNKIPSFIKLDEVVRKLAGEGKDTKAQRLMNLEAQKSDMRETLGRRWTQIQRYVVSLVPLLADSLPTEQAGVVVATEPRAAATLTATTDAHHEHEAFGVVTEEAAAAGGSGGGVEIDGVVYTQTGANGTGVQAAAVAGEPAQAHGGDAQSTDVESTYSDDASAERGGDDKGEAPPAKRAFASNAFAVSGRKTKDGSTFLAINSHQPWAGPFSWYVPHHHYKRLVSQYLLTPSLSLSLCVCVSCCVRAPVSRMRVSLGMRRTCTAKKAGILWVECFRAVPFRCQAITAR